MRKILKIFAFLFEKLCSIFWVAVSNQVLLIKLPMQWIFQSNWSTIQGLNTFYYSSKFNVKQKRKVLVWFLSFFGTFVDGQLLIFGNTLAPVYLVQVVSSETKKFMALFCALTQYFCTKLHFQKILSNDIYITQAFISFHNSIG